VNLLRWLYNQLLGTVHEDEKPDDLIVVALPNGEEIGGMLKAKLESERIHSMLRDVSPLYRGYRNWAPELELVVRRTDVQRARSILGARPLRDARHESLKR
jgi:hypothetical protein